MEKFTLCPKSKCYLHKRPCGQNILDFLPRLCTHRLSWDGGRKKSGGRGGFGAQRANLSAGLDFEIGLPGSPVHVALMSLVIIVLDGEHSGADEVRFPDPLFATFKFFDTC